MLPRQTPPISILMHLPSPAELHRLNDAIGKQNVTPEEAAFVRRGLPSRWEVGTPENHYSQSSATPSLCAPFSAIPRCKRTLRNLRPKPRKPAVGCAMSPIKWKVMPGRKRKNTADARPALEAHPQQRRNLAACMARLAGICSGSESTNGSRIYYCASSVASLVTQWAPPSCSGGRYRCCCLGGHGALPLLDAARGLGRIAGARIRRLRSNVAGVDSRCPRGRHERRLPRSRSFRLLGQASATSKTARWSGKDRTRTPREYMRLVFKLNATRSLRP